MLFKVKLLSKGDRVLNVWDEKIAILRANGEVDIYQILISKNGLPQISENVWKIAFGNGGIEITPNDIAATGDDDNSDDFEISIRQPKLK